MTVSVIIPSTGRNALDRAINSVLNGEFPDYEIIVVDDSTGQTIEHSRAFVIKTGGKRGVSFSRNLGIEMSKGEWIAFLDDDDFWAPNHLVSNLEFAKNQSLDFVISSARLIRTNEVRPLIRLGLCENPTNLLYSDMQLFKSKAYLPTAGYIVKNNLAKKLKFDERLIDRENLDFVMRAFQGGYRIQQSNFVTTFIDYEVTNSLKRANLESEINWYKYLEFVNPIFATNFQIQSMRNFTRVRDYKNALEIFKLGHSSKLKNKAILKLMLYMNKIISLVSWN